jgi:hypothetical protein
MRFLDRRPWQIWSIVLKTIGGTGCLAIIVWSFGLIGYYSVKRPREPEPEKGWTVSLPWTNTTYGTLEEAAQLLGLHDWFFPFFVVLGAGVAIEKFKEKYEPWRKKSF